MARAQPSAPPEGIGDDVDATVGIDQSHIEPHRRQAVMSAAFAELAGGKADPPHLPGRQALRGKGVTFRFLHFDENQLVILHEDEVYLAGLATPPAGQKPGTCRDVMALDAILGHQARKMCDPTAALPPSDDRDLPGRR